MIYENRDGYILEDARWLCDGIIVSLSTRGTFLLISLINDRHSLELKELPLLDYVQKHWERHLSLPDDLPEVDWDGGGIRLSERPVMYEKNGETYIGPNGTRMRVL